MKSTTIKHIQKKNLDAATSSSSKIEGLSFSRACKNKKVITKLKKYGRGFSI